MSLASQERSARRELFEQVKKEKQLLADKQADEMERQRLLDEEEEIRKIRE